MRRVALVTGATRGLGAAIARELSSTHRILVGGTDATTVGHMVDELDDAAPFVADLRDDEALARAAAGVERVDVLVHNAGVEAAMPVADTTRDDWRDIFEVNLFAVAQLTQLLLPKLRDVGGLVIAVNSGSGYRSGARGGLYSGSKFALRAFTDALREEERGRVRVTSIHPGRADTDMQRAMMDRDGREYQQDRYLRPESVAATVRLAVDTTPEASIDELQIRPAAAL